MPTDRTAVSHAFADPADGQRIGRFIFIRDIDGQLHAVAALAVSVLRVVDDGTLLMLPGGKILHVEHSIFTMLAWLDGRG